MNHWRKKKLTENVEYNNLHLQNEKQTKWIVQNALLAATTKSKTNELCILFGDQLI